MRSHADSQTTSLALTAVLVAVAVCLGYAEAVLLPTMPVAGVRIGLANIAVVMALAFLGSGRALLVSVVRVVLVAAITGTLGGPAFVFALSGAVAAWLAMCAVARAGHLFSVIGWSVAGSAAHVSAQLLVASFFVGSAVPLLMLPASLGLALATGLVTGHLSRLLLSRIPSPSLSAA